METKRYLRRITPMSDENALLLVIAALVIVIGLGMSSLLVRPSVDEFLVMLASLFVFYVALIVFLSIVNGPREITNSSIVERPIIKEIIREVEKPVIKEVVKIVEKPVIKEVVREIEKPVIKEIVKEIEKPVFVRSPVRNLDIPKYNYLGSTEAMTFHKRGCRFSKLIKRKYKKSGNNQYIFVREGFVPCKVCFD